MSWLFGRKKHHRDSPPSSPETEAPSGSQGDDFIFIERRGNQPPGPEMGDNSLARPNPIYPNINNLPGYPPALPTVAPKQTIDPIQNLISDLPFKMCKQLSSNADDDVAIDTQRVNEILSYILRLENHDLRYDFNLENGIVNEMDSRGLAT